MKEIALTRLIRTITFRRLANAALASGSFFISKLLRKPIVWGTPFILTVEPSSLCNLKCPQCTVGADELTRDQGLLDFETYRRLLNEIGDNIFYLMLFNQGEPFLHLRLLDFIRLAKEKNIYVSISTNGHFLENEGDVRQLMESGLDMLIISLDGADKQTYSKYRTGGDFQKVIEGLQTLFRIKIEMQQRSPEIALQFLVMRHNQDQVPLMKVLAARYGIRRLLLKSVQVEDVAAAQKFLPADESFHRYELSDARLELKANLNAACPRLWTSTVLLSDGSIAPCCFDKDGDYPMGTITCDSTFTHLWRSPDYQRFRKRILKRRHSVEICRNCTQGLKIFH